MMKNKNYQALKQMGAALMKKLAKFPWQDGKDEVVKFLENNAELIYRGTINFLKNAPLAGNDKLLTILLKDPRNGAISDLLRITCLYADEMRYKDTLINWHHFLICLAYLWHMRFDCEVPQVLADDMDALEKYLKEND